MRTGAFLTHLSVILAASIGLCQPVFGAKHIPGRSQRSGQAILKAGDMRCESLLLVDLDQRVKALKDSELVTHEGLDPQAVRVRLTLITPDKNAVTGVFTHEDEAAHSELPSPKNNLAAFLLDQLLGGYAKVPLATPWVYREKSGVFQIEPRTYALGKSGAPSKPTSENLAHLALFDFLIQKFPRPKTDLVLTENGFAAINNWGAFNRTLDRSKMRDDHAIRPHMGILKRSWRHANPAFKRMILGLERDTLDDELSEALSPAQIEEVWIRLTLLQSLE